MEPGVFERCQRHAAQCDAGPGCPAAAYCQEGSAGTAVDRCRDCDPLVWPADDYPADHCLVCAAELLAAKIPGGAGVNTRVAGPASNA